MFSDREHLVLSILGLTMVVIPLLLWMSWTKDVFYILLIAWGSCFWAIALMCHRPWRRWLRALTRR